MLELAPSRLPDGNKFASGSALVVGGSTGLTGAVCLACEAAMRAGAGWVRAGVPASLNQIFEIKLTEVMTLPLPDSDGHLAGAAAEQVARGRPSAPTRSRSAPASAAQRRRSRLRAA